MYVFIPNTHVQFRAALIGGVTAGIIWALVGKVFTGVIVYLLANGGGLHRLSPSC